MTPPRRPPVNRWRRAAYAIGAAAAFAAAVALTRRHGVSWWYLGVFAVWPDVTLLIGMRGAKDGRLAPKAVPYYNAAHRLIGPVVLGAAVVAFSWAWFVGALAWAGHISLDRALGFNLRAPDGTIRPG